MYNIPTNISIHVNAFSSNKIMHISLKEINLTLIIPLQSQMPVTDILISILRSQFRS